MMLESTCVDQLGVAQFALAVPVVEFKLAFVLLSIRVRPSALPMHFPLVEFADVNSAIFPSPNSIPFNLSIPKLALVLAHALDHKLALVSVLDTIHPPTTVAEQSLLVHVDRKSTRLNSSH